MRRMDDLLNLTATTRPDHLSAALRDARVSTAAWRSATLPEEKSKTEPIGVLLPAGARLYRKITNWELEVLVLRAKEAAPAGQ